MANTKAIIIGSTPTYRGEYSDVAIYYKENVVSCYSCVFKAVANNFSNIPPILVDSEGYISVANTAAWTCVIDNTGLYNLALQYKEIKIKTINGQSLIGEGNVVIEGGEGGSISIDSRPDANSENPLQNKVVTALFSRLEESISAIDGSAVSVAYWQSTMPQAKINGTRFYNTSTDTLYVCQKNDNESVGRWVEETPSKNKLYVNADRSDWCKWNGSKMVGIGLGKVGVGELDSFVDNAIADAEAPSNYVVVNSEQISVGTLTMYSDTDKKTLTQILDTNLILGSDNTFDGGQYSTQRVNRYFRVFGLSENDEVPVGSWTEWKASTFNVDVDTNFSKTSENPIANNTVTEKFEELEGLIGDLEKDVFYFYGYEDTPLVELENVEFTGESGKIIYLVQQNIFVLKADSRYYTEWSAVDNRLSSEWYNKEEDGTLKIRSDKFYCLVGEEEANPFMEIDPELNDTSGNAVANKAITKEFGKIWPFTATITKMTAGDNGSYVGVCNNNFETIGTAFMSGRVVTIVDRAFFRTAFRVIQIPMGGTDETVGIMVSADKLYTFSMVGALITFKPYAIASSESGTNASSPDIDSAQIKQYANIPKIALWSENHQNKEDWEGGDYWYDPSDDTLRVNKGGHDDFSDVTDPVLLMKDDNTLWYWNGSTLKPYICKVETSISDNNRFSSNPPTTHAVYTAINTATTEMKQLIDSSSSNSFGFQVLKLKSNNYQDKTGWAAGDYWYKDGSLKTGELALKRCTEVVEDTPIFEDVSDVKILFYLESASSKKLYLWTGFAMYHLADNPI